jgi:hypothetical protein
MRVDLQSFQLAEFRDCRVLDAQSLELAETWLAVQRAAGAAGAGTVRTYEMIASISVLLR